MGPGAGTAGQVLVDTLAALGASHIYTVPGESFLDVLEAARRNQGVRLVSTRHESGAAFMADADAKLTGRPAIAAATRAPGGANLAIGVHTARHDSTPMIVVVGQVPTDLIGTEAFQAIDLEAFYRPITKWTTTLRYPAEAAGVARQAFAAATSGRPGPALIVVPADVGAAGAAEQGPLDPIPPPAPPDRGVVAAIRDRLAGAERPVMIVGGRTAGCWGDLVRLAEHYGLGVYSAFRRQDHFPNDHRCYLGHLGLAADPALLEPLAGADVVVALGCRLSQVTTQGFTLPGPASYLVHVDGDAATAGAGPGPVADLAVSGDVASVLGALTSGLDGPPAVRSWDAAHRLYEVHSSPPPAPPSGLIRPDEVMAALAHVAGDDTIVTNDAGNFSIFLHRYRRFARPFTQLAPTSGAMGYAVPAAVAAGLVRPGRAVVAVAGDGGFLMTGQEVETAVRYGSDLTVVVVRNGLYGTIAMHQARTFGATYGVDIGDVDLAGYARSLGATGFSVRDRSALGDALAEAMAAPGPAVVDVEVDPDVITPTSRLSVVAAQEPYR